MLVLDRWKISWNNVKSVKVKFIIGIGNMLHNVNDNSDYNLYYYW